jgi:hypothetical protein
MHYRNGREAKNGDVIVSVTPSNHMYNQTVLRTGVLFNAQPGNDYCNGTLVPLTGGMPEGACLADCFHIDDVLEMIGGAARPPGK